MNYNSDLLKEFEMYEQALLDRMQPFESAPE
jgi:hypothetical protein